MKEKYTRKTGSDGKISDSWDGESYKRTGFGEDGYLIQVNLEHCYKDGHFGIRILNCRQNMSLTGYEFQDGECTFTNLGVCVYEGTTEADWS